MLYLLNSEQIEQLNQINNQSFNEIVTICDHGEGPSIDDDFLSMEGFESQKQWFNANVDNFTAVEDDIELEV
jgi:hypothetical protein